MSDEQKALAVPKEVETNIEAISDYVNTLALTTDEDVEEASKRIFMISSLLKQVETQRTDITKPINQSLKSINAFFKKFSERLEAMDETLRGKVKEYVQDKDRKTYALITVKSLKTVKIINADELPREYLQPDLKRIKDDLLEGKTIAGAELVEEKNISL